MNSLYLDSTQTNSSQQTPAKQFTSMAGFAPLGLWQVQQQNQKILLTFLQQEQQRQLQQQQLLLTQQLLSLKSLEQLKDQQNGSIPSSMNLVSNQNALSNLLLKNLENSSNIGQANGFQFGNRGVKIEFQANVNPNLQKIQANLAGLRQANTILGNSDSLQSFQHRISGTQPELGAKNNNDSTSSLNKEILRETPLANTAAAMEILSGQNKIKQEEDISILRTEQEKSQNDGSEDLSKGDCSEEDFEEPKNSKVTNKGSRSKKIARKARIRCRHSDRKHYAKGLCNNCYHKFGRKDKPWLCDHALHYAKGWCQKCYITQYKQKRKQEKLQIAQQAMPVETNSSSLED